MAQTTYLASAVLMGLLLAGVVLFASRRGTSRRYTTATTFGRDAATRGEAKNRDVPTVVGLLALAGIATVGTLLAVNLVSNPSIASIAGLLLLFAGVISLGGFLVWGVHSAARYRGLKGAQAVGVGVWILSLFLVCGVIVALIMAG